MLGDLEVIAGMFNLQIQSNSQKFGVESKYAVGNIAILVLEKSIEFKRYDNGVGDANSICLAKGMKFADNTKLDFFGWIIVKGNVANQGLKMHNFVISSAACAKDKRFNKTLHMCLKSSLGKGEQPLAGSPLAKMIDNSQYLLGLVVETGENYLIATKLDGATFDWVAAKA